MIDLSLKKHIPWSLRSPGQFLNTYGDAWFFKRISRTKPITTNPSADTGVHSAVPHKYLYAYLVAIKSLLHYYPNLAVYAHDDGSLRADDKETIRNHLPGVIVIDRSIADERFESEVGDDLLSKVRSSYTSYIKLFDPTLFNTNKRIIILDTDTLFLHRPDYIIDWARKGGAPWYHLAPRGNMNASANQTRVRSNYSSEHIQTLIIQNLVEINNKLDTHYSIEQGFCSGFIGFSTHTFDLVGLRPLFDVLYHKLGDKIFRWGAEQTVHGLLLTEAGAQPLPIEDYFVFTRHNATEAANATFVHFVGENRFYRMIYPKLASKITGELARQ
ncbi:hypothetical protein N9H39_00840 [Gammaproteobacteria bacterium]|nr:hypothetical protein [Gammaproteobacteria bacterium]